MLLLERFNLRNNDEWQLFYSLFDAYLKKVCDEKDYLENINDLHDEKLNAELIEQTLQKYNPYFIMKIMNDGICVGLISYSCNDKAHSAFINNFFIVDNYRNKGIGSRAYTLVEEHLLTLKTATIELIPVDNSERFYIRNGFELSHLSSEGEKIYRKRLVL